MYLNVDGAKASEIERRLRELGLKPAIGDHDFMYDWNRVVDASEVVAFADLVQARLKGTGVVLRFTTIR